MQDFAMPIVVNLLRTTLALSLAGGLVWFALRAARPTSPVVHRAAWLMVLLVGWTFLRVPLSIPWHELPAEAVPTEVAELATPNSEIVELAPPGRWRADLFDSNDEQIAAPAASSAVPFDPFADDPPVSSTTQAGQRIEAAPSVPRQAEMLMPEESLATMPAVATALDPPATIVDELPAEPWRPRWAAIGLCVWLGGVTTILLLWVVAYLRFALRLPSSLAVDEHWVVEWRETLADCGVTRPIVLRITHDCGPLLCRLPRGYELLVPESFWRSLEPPARRAILRHELAHYTRGDLEKSLAARLLALPHWFNPLAWAAVRHWDEAAEWACDALAARDIEVTDYATLLVRLGESATAPVPFAPAASGHTLSTRIKRLLTFSQQEDSNMKKLAIVALGIVLLALAVVRVQLVAKEPPARPPSNVADGPTISPYLNLLLAEAREVNREGDPIEDLFNQPRVATQPNADAATKLPPIAPAMQKVIDTAKATYTALVNTRVRPSPDLDVLYTWSLRWANAEQSAARNKGERVAAAESHLQRMRAMHARIQPFRELGTRDASDVKVAAADYYVADAERRLQDALSLAESKVSLVNDVPEVANQGEVDRLSRERKTLDRYIENVTTQISERKAQAQRLQKQEQSELVKEELQRIATAQEYNQKVLLELLNMRSAQEWHKSIDEPRDVRSPGPNTWNDVPADRSSAEQWERQALRRNAEEARRAIEELENPRQQRERDTIIQQESGSPRQPKELVAPWGAIKVPRYEGKTFDEWYALISIDLGGSTPEKVIEALIALGSRSDTRRVVKGIVEIVGRYYPKKDTGKVIGVITRLPQRETISAVIEGLKSASENSRFFCLDYLRVMNAREAIPAIYGLWGDSNLDIRKAAVSTVVEFDPESQELMRNVRWALDNHVDEIAIAAAKAWAQLAAKSGRTEGDPWAMAGSVRESDRTGMIGLLSHPNSVIVDSASLALERQGDDAVLPLAEARERGTPEVSQRAALVLDRIAANGIEVMSREKYRQRIQAQEAEMERIRGESPRSGGPGRNVPDSTANLRYQGKSLKEWLALLKTEIDQDKRSDVLRALAEFGARGNSAEIAKPIVDVMGEYDVGRDGTIVGSAVDALKKLPSADTLPLLNRALELKNKSAPFAVLAIVGIQWKDSAPTLMRCTEHADPIVRSLAIYTLGALAGESAEFNQSLRKAIDRNNAEMVESALYGVSDSDRYVESHRPWPPNGPNVGPPLPYVYRLVDLSLRQRLIHDNPIVRQAAEMLLVRQGTSAIAGLRKFAQALDNPELTQHIEVLIKRIEAAETKPAAEQPDHSDRQKLQPRYSIPNALEPGTTNPYASQPAYRAPGRGDLVLMPDSDKPLESDPLKRLLEHLFGKPTPKSNNSDKVEDPIKRLNEQLRGTGAGGRYVPANPDPSQQPWVLPYAPAPNGTPLYGPTQPIPNYQSLLPYNYPQGPLVFEGDIRLLPNYLKPSNPYGLKSAPPATTPEKEPAKDSEKK